VEAFPLNEKQGHLGALIGSALLAWQRPVKWWRPHHIPKAKGHVIVSVIYVYVDDIHDSR